jgi:hypothetical protein
MSGHTPGPWRLQEDDSSGRIVVVADRIGLIAILAEHDFGIAESDQDDANARLIAAAPELLEALRLCAPRAFCVFPQHPIDEPCDGCRGWKLALAVIAKIGRREFDSWGAKSQEADR